MATHKALNEQKTSIELSPDNWLLRRVQIGAAVGLAAVSAALLAETSIGTKFADRGLRRLQAMNQPMKAPTAEDGVTITVGDFIEYKTPDGKTHKRKVQLLSDITVAATRIDSGIDPTAFNDMLNSEHGGKAYHFGDTYRIDKDLGIRDIGH